MLWYMYYNMYYNMYFINVKYINVTVFFSFVAHVNLHESVAIYSDIRTAGSSHRPDYVKRPPKSNAKFDAAFKTDAVVMRGTSTGPKPATKKKEAGKAQYATSDDDEDGDKVYFTTGLCSLFLLHPLNHSIIINLSLAEQERRYEEEERRGHGEDQEYEDDEESEEEVDEVAVLMTLKDPPKKAVGKRPIAKAPDTPPPPKRGRAASSGDDGGSPTPTGKKYGRKPAPRLASPSPPPKKAHPLSKDYRGPCSDSEESPEPKKKKGGRAAPPPPPNKKKVAVAVGKNSKPTKKK